jgi:outer membrane lipoprotein-sorting protein
MKVQRVRRRWSLASLVILVGLVSLSGSASAQEKEEEASAETIVERALQKNSMEFDSGTAQMTLRIEDRNGDRSERAMTVKSREIDGAVRTLVELTSPEELKGQSFLFAENDEGSDDVWMYVPAFSVTRRIEGSKKQGAFLGSHFTYSDLESRDVERAKYERKEDGTVGDNEVYVIEATPEESVASEYGKVELFIRKSDHVPLRFRFYDKEDEKVKTLFVRKLDETEEGRTYIKQMEMHAEQGGYTRLTIEGLNPGAEVPASAFNKDQLGK